ncbi:MAG: ATP-binding cassette domain-containing protein [Actinobacteria bacterium]|nr:ATP-binding cassette domain-containing protein [Actinomycetota bacterium]
MKSTSEEQRATQTRGTDGTVLEVESVDAGYGEMKILHAVSARVDRGELVSIIGPNGAGKSTVLKCILGLIKPTKGRVLFKGENITANAPHKIIASGIGYVPQGRIVFPDMSVLENLEMGGFTVRDKARLTGNLERVFDLFPVLDERRKQMAGTMSGGQQQMLAIGRALMSGPETILLDEPSLGLAPRFVDIVFEGLLRMGQEGITMVVVEQNAARALEMADRAYVLEFGRNRFEGTGEELLNDERVRRLYLGG